MKKETQVIDNDNKKTNSAAENIDSTFSVSEPKFQPTVAESSLQLKTNPLQLSGIEGDDNLQMKKAPFQLKGEEEEESMQLRENSNVPSPTRESSTQTKLPDPVQAKMESSFGTDFSNVSIHKDSSKAENLGAQAYAQGSEVHFAPGKYDPSSQSGQELIGHELTHVVQQRQGRVQPTTQRKGASINDSSSLEQEADHLGLKAAKSEPFNLKVGSDISNNQTIQGNFLGDAADWAMDRIGDATNTRENEAELDAQEDTAEKAAFLSRNFGPITYTRPNISGSGFEASYFPGANLLNAEVRAKVRYADGIVDNGTTVSSPNEFMNRGRLMTVLSMFPALKAQVLPYFQWGAEEKAINLIRFKENIKATMNIWENTGMSFQVNQSGWEDVTARPNININVAEGTAIHATENYGPFGMLTRTDEQGSDHLQLEIVKQLNASDAATVNALVANYINNLPVPGLLKNALMPPVGDATGVRSYLGNNPNSNADAGHNNFMSLESNRSDDPAAKEFTHTSSFENDASNLLPSEEARLDAFLADPQVLLRNPSGTMNIDLEGFASAPGSTEYNTELVNRRLTTVADIINTKIDSSNLNIRRHVDPAAERNNSDRDAEDTKENDPTNYHDEAYRAVDIKIRHSGRGGQNVLAHEFGHIFGLGDEYAETANGYNRPAGALADHDQLAKDAGVPGGAVVGNDQRILSTGNNVGAAHYSTFADALRQLTGKPWKIIP
jgi:outer membrane protein OmpA-like peptidoglycan-associated protein